MNVLYLTGKSPIITPSDIDGTHSILLSFGYRHRIPQGVLDLLPCFNLHISMLPWNRGASPNLWAWHDGTPHGVTLHLMDEGFDTGPIVARREVEFSGRETFASSYESLTRAGLALIHDWLPRIMRDQYIPTPQTATGTFHTKMESDELFNSLPQGWRTPVSFFRRAA